MEPHGRAGHLPIVDGALNPVPLCDLDQAMLKEVMAENRGLVSYVPTSTYFTKKVYIKCRGCPTFWGYSMVCIGKNIAICHKNPPFLPVMCTLCTRCADTHPFKQRWSLPAGITPGNLYSAMS